MSISNIDSVEELAESVMRKADWMAKNASKAKRTENFSLIYSIIKSAMRDFPEYEKKAEELSRLEFQASDVTVASELVAVAKSLVARVQEGETYSLDLKTALKASWAIPQWSRLVRQIYKRGDGYVTVENINYRNGTADVYEGNNPGARILGTVQVPIEALK